MNWKRLRQNAEDKLKLAFLDPDPGPETAQIQLLVERTEPAEAQREQEAPLLPYQSPGWTPPILTSQRKRRIDVQDRRMRGLLSEYISPY